MQKRNFKTARKLTAAKQYRKWSDWKVGDYIIGKYVETYTDEKYDKEVFVIDVIEASFKDGTGKKFENKHLGLNSIGMLAKALQKVGAGEIVQVNYNGKSQMEKGKYAGKEAHSVDILVLEEDESDLLFDEEEGDNDL
jgi:hypothetical protein